MRKFCSLLLSLIMILALLLPITTVTVTYFGKKYVVDVSAVQFFQGYFWSETDYSDNKAEVSNKMLTLVGVDAENYYKENAGALYIYELNLQDNTAQTTHSIPLMIVSLLFLILLGINLILFAIIGLFVERFSKVNILISIVTLIGVLFVFLIDISWLKSIYYVATMGVGMIIIILCPIFVLINSIVLTNRL